MSMDISREADEDFDALATRRKQYKRCEPEVKRKDTEKRKLPQRKNEFFKCFSHSDTTSKLWTSANGECNDCILFEPSPQLPNGKLPLLSQVISFVLHALQDDTGHRDTVHRNVTLDLMNHWIFCNVYTQTYTTVKKKIEDYLKEYNALKNYPKVKRKATHWTRVQSFVADCRKMMDIICGTDRIKSQENMYGVKFDNEFYERQSSIPQIGYCTTFTEHKWKMSQNRKQLDQERTERAKQKAKVSNIYTRCVFNNMVRTCDDQYKVFKCNYGLSSEYKISCA